MVIGKVTGGYQRGAELKENSKDRLKRKFGNAQAKEKRRGNSGIRKRNWVNAR